MTHHLIGAAEEGAGISHISLPISGGGLLLLVVVLYFAFNGGEGKQHHNRSVRQGIERDREFFAAVWAGLKGAWSLLRFLALFVSGMELNGQRRTNAGLLKPGRRPLETERPMPASQLGSVAAPVSLVKRNQPRPWARKAARVLREYDGRGARVLTAAGRTALWLAHWTGKVVRAVRAVYRAVHGVVGPFARLLGAWACWPYAARAVTRLALVAAVVGLIVPAWRTWALLGLGAGTLGLALLARVWTPKDPSDAVRYGPALWAILREDLRLPEDADREQWLHLPEELADPSARIVVQLPWNWRGSELEREQLGELINSRLPGEWVGRYDLRSATHVAVFRHKPAPKPKPEPPSAVDVNERRVQDALNALADDEFLLGIDENGQPLIRKMSGEMAHWALSVGSGGGKSTNLQWLAVQMVMKRGTVIGIDPKLISLLPLEGVEGIHIYKDPENGFDMRESMEWTAEVVAARFFEYEQGIRTEFPPLYLILEECNELAGLLKAVWNRIRIKSGEDKDPAGDPIWEDVVAYILRFGRAANVHIIAVFQDFKDNQFGGTSLLPLFRLKALGNYETRQWERITGMTRTDMPPSISKAGRMVMVSDGKIIRYQTPYLFLDTEDGEKRPATEAEATEIYGKLYRQLRECNGYTTDALYSTPPAHSPKGVPRLLRDRVDLLSRDTSADASTGGSEGGLSDETAGGGVTHTEGVTGGVTAPRDRLRLIPGQADARAVDDATAPPELLPLAQVARRLEDVPGVPSYGTMRQHKGRRDDFPKGVEIDGKECYTESQIRAYYIAEEKNA